MGRFAVGDATPPCGPQSDPKKHSCVRRCVPKGSLCSPKREPADGVTAISGELSLAAIREVAVMAYLTE